MRAALVLLTGLLTMGYTLVHQEDWSGYGTSIAAVNAAYPVWDGSGPYDIPSNYNTSVGPTEGPNGGPGIADLAGDYTFIMKHVPMTCRDFKIEVLYDFTGWTPSAGMQIGQIMSGWHGDPYSPSMSEFSDMLFQIHHGKATDGLQVRANTTGSVGTSFNTGMMAGVVPSTGNVQFRVEGRLSTITGSPGSFSAAADGYLKVYVNNVLVADTGLVTLWHHDASIPSGNTTYSPYWNIVELGIHGKVGLWEVYASDDCNIVTVDDDADVCCADGDPDIVQAGGGHGAGASPVQTPLIGGSPIGCAGGGTVPTQADLTHSETWWGHS